MIRRDVDLQNMYDFDFFNDYDDTLKWLQHQIERTDDAVEKDCNFRKTD
jgi:hypothetical protein